MDAAIAIGVAATVVALLGLLGRPADSRPWPSRVIVLGFPLAIIAGGYAASIGMTALWAFVAVLSVFLAVMVGGLLGRPPALDDQRSQPAAAGLSLVFSGLIALGLAVIVIAWAGHLIAAFTLLNHYAVVAVLTLAAVACGIGGRAVVGLSRLVLGLIAAGALAVLAVGLVAGDVSGLASPQVPVPALNPATGVVFAIGVVLIGAGFPVLRVASHNNRKSAVVAAVVLALVVAVYLVGMLALYGGAYQLPSLVVNVLPVYTPAWLGALISGCVAVVAAVVAGECLHAASRSAATIVPAWYEDVEHHLGPRRWVALAMGAAVFVVAALSPSPQAVVAVLAVLGAANLVVERILARAQPLADQLTADPLADDPAGASAGAG
jgi:hypothetical protein